MKIPKIFIKVFGVIFALIIIYIIFIFFILIPKIEKNTISLEDTIGKIQLQKTVQLVQSYAQELNNYQTFALQQRKDELKQLTRVVYSIIDANYKKSLLKDANVSKIQDDTLELIAKLRYGNNDYFYVSNYHNILISHPYLKGRDFSNVHDIHGELIVPRLVEVARKNGEGFIRYWWQKNNQDRTQYEKLTYAKNFMPWKWIVGTGVYIDDIKFEVQKRKKVLIAKLKTILHKTKIGKNGYIYIFDDAGNMIVHQNKAIEGKNFKYFRNPGKKSYILDDLVKAYKHGNKILYYNWDAPDDRGNYTYKKISWIEYDPNFHWYICSSEYLDEARADSENLKKFIIYAIFVMIFVIVGIGLYFVRQIFQPVLQLADNAQEVIDGNLEARYEGKINNDEIGLLAKQYNTMLQTIQTQMETLDIQVQEKTKELTHTLEAKEVLLREINHRVKNNLYVISSIIGLQAFKTKDIKIEDFIQTVQQRIQAMAIGHELLSKSVESEFLDAKEYIPHLVHSLIEAYLEDPSACHCVYEIDHVRLDVDKLLSCGLIINELVTNAIKYALHTSSYLLVRMQEKDMMIHLTIADKGSGFVEEESRDGIGLELVDMLVKQLSGSMEIIRSEGTLITISFPK
jgi:two-component sensor histidine kinase